MWCHLFRLTFTQKRSSMPSTMPFAIYTAVGSSFIFCTFIIWASKTIRSTIPATDNTTRRLSTFCAPTGTPMWVPVASFGAHTGVIIVVVAHTRAVRWLAWWCCITTITNTSTNKVCCRRRRCRRRYIDHRRIGAGTVRVASDQGRTDHRCDNNFFHHRNRSRVQCPMSNVCWSWKHVIIPSCT